MSSTKTRFDRILVATDFSPHAETALRRAVWLARQSKAKLTLAHALPDLNQVLQSASLRARIDLLSGGGEEFQREVRRASDAKMHQSITDLDATDLDVKVETLLGEPFVELTHAVQAERYDLVVAGMRGLTAWEKVFVGSTAKRLIRKCPASVWIVKGKNADPPQCVLAATDFSHVSRKAVLQGYRIAQQAQAAFHLLHVVDSQDVPDDALEKLPHGGTLRAEINAEAKRRLEEFVASLPVDSAAIHSHLSWGTPWQEICRTAQHLRADLIALGTVGRSGIPGLLLGNTAEKVLETCESDILTVKSDDFVSPIQPPFWPLHPGEEPSGKGLRVEG